MLGGVVQKQHRPIDGRDSFLGGLKMTAENVLFADRIVIKESIRSFGIGAILAGRGYALSYLPEDLPDDGGCSWLQALVAKLASSHFFLNPTLIFW